MDADLDTLCSVVYCTADDLLPEARANTRRTVTDAEAVTLCVAQAIMGIPSERRFLLAARRYVGATSALESRPVAAADRVAAMGRPLARAAVARPGLVAHSALATKAGRAPRIAAGGRPATGEANDGETASPGAGISPETHLALGLLALRPTGRTLRRLTTRTGCTGDGGCPGVLRP